MKTPILAGNHMVGLSVSISNAQDPFLQKLERALAHAGENERSRYYSLQENYLCCSESFKEIHGMNTSFSDSRQRCANEILRRLEDLIPVCQLSSGSKVQGVHTALQLTFDFISGSRKSDPAFLTLGDAIVISKEIRELGKTNYWYDHANRLLNNVTTEHQRRLNIRDISYDKFEAFEKQLLDNHSSHLLQLQYNCLAELTVPLTTIE